MIFDKAGQTFSAGGKVYAVGGTAWCPRERNGELFCTIRAIRAEDNEAPTAQCDFGEDGTKCLPLDVLEPVSPSVPEETGRRATSAAARRSWCPASILGTASPRTMAAPGARPRPERTTISSCRRALEPASTASRIWRTMTATCRSDAAHGGRGGPPAIHKKRFYRLLFFP